MPLQNPFPQSLCNGKSAVWLRRFAPRRHRAAALGSAHTFCDQQRADGYLVPVVEQAAVGKILTSQK